MVVPFRLDFGALTRGFAFAGWCAWSTAAAIVGEISDQRVHRLEPGRIDHRAALAAHRDDAGDPQPVEMKGQRVGRETKRFGDGARSHTLEAGLHQQAEHVEAVVLGEGGQGRDGI